jgi:hypothetical protein
MVCLARMWVFRPCPLVTVTLPWQASRLPRQMSLISSRPRRSSVRLDPSRNDAGALTWTPGTPVFGFTGPSTGGLVAGGETVLAAPW